MTDLDLNSAAGKVGQIGRHFGAPTRSIAASQRGLATLRRPIGGIGIAFGLTASVLKVVA